MEIQEIINYQFHKLSGCLIISNGSVLAKRKYRKCKNISHQVPGASRRNVFEIMPDFGSKIPLLLVSQKMAIQQKQPHTCFCVFIMSHRMKLHSVRAKSQGIPCSKQMQYLKFKKTATGLEPTTT